MLSAVMFISNLHFIMFGSAEVQPWNKPKENRDEGDGEEFPEIGKHVNES